MIGVNNPVTLRFWARLLAVLTYTTIPAAACTCGGVHGRNAWEMATRAAAGWGAIFEGTIESYETRWPVLNAAVGQLVPTIWSGGDQPFSGPAMVVKFRVHRAYKGSLGTEVQLITGFGGGDCGAQFSTGITYLVYASDYHGQLTVSMCSPGGWIGSERNETYLRYLRNERPTSGDLADLRPGSPGESRARYEDFKNRYTGTICGTVLANISSQSQADVHFLSTSGSSPAAHPIAKVGGDGKFCSDALGPGKYYLYFLKYSSGIPESAVYYPGVPDRAHAISAEAIAGQTISDLVLKVPRQEPHSVRGLILIDNKWSLDSASLVVRLMSVEGEPLHDGYDQEIDLGGRLPLPNLKYFSFNNVLPGRYLISIGVNREGWSYKKTEIDVASTPRFVFLELKHAAAK